MTDQGSCFADDKTIDNIYNKNKIIDDNNDNNNKNIQNMNIFNGNGNNYGETCCINNKKSKTCNKCYIMKILTRFDKK